MNPGGQTATATVTTESATGVGSAGATLQGSFSGATGRIYETGFYYGTSLNSMTQKVTTDGTNDSSGDFLCTLVSLASSTKYYFRAYVLEYNQSTGQYEERTATNYGSFTTPAQSLMDYQEGWLELPALKGDEDYFGYFYGSGGNTDANRNYSYNYSYTYYASLWTAYPLKYDHKSGSASTSSWSFNPNIDEAYQVDMTGNSYPTMYNANNYSKGHQCPNADRKSNQQMNSQTYYCTNQTPQIQTGFNGSIWSALETAERNLVTKSGDIVYVVTGPVYRTVGGNEEITYLNAAIGKNAYPAQVPVPNFYWKAILKVKMNGDTIEEALAIGFWFEHKQYDDSKYYEHTCSVDYIEQMTGFDLFTNLPGTQTSGIEKTAETNSNWTTFQNF